jgi:hypothetical protein
MTRHVLTFAATFVVGALLALLARAALFEPYAETAPAPAVPAVADAHAGHVPVAAPAPAADAKPVNTVCAMCGMDVDPKLPTAVYQGKVIGFGCRMCPPKFAKDPDRWGPLYLGNEVVTR